MDKGSHGNQARKNALPKEVFKDLGLVSSHRSGRDSPESGSLYSDYESGQQYEDKDLPSGYNSGEQYDTMSTGYMSGEAYELPEARPEPMEVKLSSIEEHSGATRSNEDLFTLSHSQVTPESGLLVQTEKLESDSSSSIQEQGLLPESLPAGPDSVTAQAQHKVKRKKKDHSLSVSVPENAILLQTEVCESSSSSSIPKNKELASVLDPLNLHKLKSVKKLGKKSVSYHVSVPMEASPLGHDVKMKIPRTVLRDPPSDTDTTSCFDSDGTYMRSECQSSDSGAVLLKENNKKHRRNRSRDRELGDTSAIIKSGKKRIRKAKHIIRNSTDFFDRYDNKYWAMARAICFWASTLGMMACIVGAGLMIVMMPRNCDPKVEWWQGKLTLDIIPENRTHGKPLISIAELIQDIPRYKSLGVETLKLRNLYLTNPDSDPDTRDPSNWELLSSAVVQQRIDRPESLGSLATKLHEAEMTLMVEVPAMQANSSGKMEYQLERAIMTAIVYWAERGVDGISIIGLEHFSSDPFLPGNIKTWRNKFEQYGTSPNAKILGGPFLLPHNIETASPAKEDEEYSSPAFKGIASLGLLDATVKVGSKDLNQEVGEAMKMATKWDMAPSQPWIHWGMEGMNRYHLTHAELAFLMFLPGTISLRGIRPDQELLIEQLAKIRRSAVPIFMNGNYKSCRSHCTSFKEKEENYLVHFFADQLLLIERNFSRRNRFMVIANMKPNNVSLAKVSHLYTGGEMILDTANLDREVAFIHFKDAELTGMQAYVIKFPK